MKPPQKTTRSVFQLEFPTIRDITKSPQDGVSAVQVRGAVSIGPGRQQYRPVAAIGDLLIGGARSGDAQVTVEAPLAEAGKPRWGWAAAARGRSDGLAGAGGGAVEVGRRSGCRGRPWLHKSRAYFEREQTEVAAGICGEQGQLDF